jgi:hypothetical protein
LDNDKVFTGYALILIAGVASVITSSVLAGFASLPTPAVFLEHVALGLMMRASYKTIGGFDWADWSFTRDRAPAEAEFAPSGPAAHAEG